MIFCSWNIKGLNQSFRQKKLKLFLSHTKINLFRKKIRSNKKDTITKLLGREMTCTADYNMDQTGRIWLCWKHQQVKVTIELATSQMVHYYMEDKGFRFASFMTFVYGYNTCGGRKEMLEQLREIHQNMNELWVILSDFNTGLSVTDRLNRAPIQQTDIQDFHDCIE
ncbi:hypothetical protein T459_08685 [Capsicum annuum]|uniref:Endonuclease/exonuclease/phosphatase domain-containing protein n=1 Tax=Capsicum annuum TaxID=4072 RepID=A0A2G2ZX85_CAPAN|nr:hypothetical protein FXO37_07946 [Capsicum annuum]PHT86579.1 hypothetical protein T459_08685 [Capsicum annuum]